MVKISGTLETKSQLNELSHYSLVGDLVSYIRCPSSYRNVQIGNLTPSRPSQMWYGNFAHGVLRELFNVYKDANARKIVLDFKNLKIDPDCYAPKSISFLDTKNNTKDEKEIFNQCQLQCKEKYCYFEICNNVINRLNMRKIFARSVEMKKKAILRLLEMIEAIGRDYFPLILFAEIELNGIRNNIGGRYYDPDKLFKDDLNKKKFSPITSINYEINGFVDVISKIPLKTQNPTNIKNLIVKNIIEQLDLMENDPKIKQNNPQLILDIKKIRNSNKDYEIIVDYKGSLRQLKDQKDRLKNAHEWQIRTYKWLREQQLMNANVIFGIIIYINEFYPTKSDIQEIIDGSIKKNLEIPIPEPLLTKMKAAYNRNDLTDYYLQEAGPEFIIKRGLKIIETIDEKKNIEALKNFDEVVLAIESCKNTEKVYGHLDIWKPNGDKDSCAACDKRTYCSKAADYSISQFPSVP